MINLNDANQTYVFQNGQWLSAASQGWVIINAERINKNNWIVGTAVNGGATYPCH